MNITSEARERVNQLARANGGRITAEQVLADAREPDSPLHGFYNWDAVSAAHEHWLETSRRIIRSVRLVIKEERVVIRSVAYVRDPAMEPRQQGYVSVAKLRSDKDLAREAFMNECVRAAAALRRAREVGTALGLRENVQLMLDQIELWTAQARRGDFAADETAATGSA